MNINLYMERLILDGISLSPDEPRVGWVERNETHQLTAENMMGFVTLYPSYGLTILVYSIFRLKMAIDLNE